MSEFEANQEVLPASSGAASEVYSLVQAALESHDSAEDSYSRAITVARYSRSSLYEGFIQLEAIDPLAEFNQTGCCAIVCIGDLAEGRIAYKIEEQKQIPHLINTYFLYHQNTRLAIRKSATVDKPANLVSKDESERLMGQNFENDLGLNIVNEIEANSLIKQIREALGLGNEPQPLPESKAREQAQSPKMRLAKWLGWLSFRNRN